MTLDTARGTRRFQRFVPARRPEARGRSRPSPRASSTGPRSARPSPRPSASWTRATSPATRSCSSWRSRRSSSPSSSSSGWPGWRPAVGRPWPSTSRSRAWLWFTVLFATYAEAVAEARGKAQAATLRKTRSVTIAHRREASGALVEVGSAELRAGDVVVVREGETIPSRRRRHRGRGLRQRGRDHGRVRARPQGAGHGHPVVGHRRHHRRLRLARDPHHRQPRRDLPGPDDRAGRGCRAPEDPQRARPVDPAGRPHAGVPAGDGHPPAVRGLRGRQRQRGRPGRPAGVPHPDHHRRPAVRHRHRGHGPRGALQRPGHERPGRGGRRRRGRDPARQDRHHHVRQPARRAGPPGTRRHGGRGPGAGPAVLAAGRDPRGPVHRRRSPVRASASWACPAPRATTRPSRRSDARIAEQRDFTAETRSSGVVLAGGEELLKGAVDAIAASLPGGLPAALAAEADGVASRGATPLALRRGTAPIGADRAQGHRQARALRAVRRVPPDGRAHGHDHRRQPAHRRHHRPRGRRRRLRRRGAGPRTRSRSSARSRPTATSSR